MNKSFFHAASVSIFLLLSGSIFAAPQTEGKFEFVNKTKEDVSIAVGTHNKPPQEHETQTIKAGASVLDTFKYDDVVQMLLKMSNGDMFTYEFDNVKPGKNIRLKLTTGALNKKTELEAQFITSNIGKKDIFMTERHLMGMAVEKFERPKAEPAKKPDADKDADKKPADEKPADDSKDKGDKDENGSEPTKKTVTPYQILNVNERGSAEDKEAKILGLRFTSTLKEARERGFISLEWDGIRNAQAEITKSYNAQKAIWNSAKVTKQAKSRLDALKVPADEHDELIKETEELIQSTYESVKSTFSELPGASDSHSSDDW